MIPKSINPILANCTINETQLLNDPTWIFCTIRDFKEVWHLIAPTHKPYVGDCLQQMRMGIDFAFWFNDQGQIEFEG